MKNQRGVTLASVVLIVVVMIIIASTSIIVGNRLILDAKEQKKEENYRAVLAAVEREAAKINMGGVITPGIHDYIGTPNPVVGRDDEGNPINAGDDWYLLNESDLAQLGIKGVSDNYIVNYKGESVYQTDELLDNCYIVTFNANGGTVNSTSKVVVYGGTYGDLPTPTREGYTFLGWNGKNMFDSSILLTVPGWTENHGVYTGIIENLQNKSYDTIEKFLSFKSNTQYTLNCTGVKESGTTPYFIFDYIDGDGDSRSTCFNTITTSQNNRTVKRLRFSYGTGRLTTISLSNIQLEEGSQATEYEPYYVTSNVKVTQNKDHTLTAIWKAN